MRLIYVTGRNEEPKAINMVINEENNKGRTVFMKTNGDPVMKTTSVTSNAKSVQSGEVKKCPTTAPKPTTPSTPTMGLTNEEIEDVRKLYRYVSMKYNHAQINMFTSMLVSLSREWEVREKIENINIDLAVQNKKCAWKKDFTSITLLPVPQIPKKGGV